MMRTPRILPLIALLGCATSSGASPSSSTAPSANGSESSANDDATTTSTTAPGETAAASRTPRATLAMARLATCTPESADVRGGTPVSVYVQPSLGGCGLRQPGPDPTESYAYELNVLGGPSRVAEVVECTEGRSPTVDFATTTYATFLSSHPSNERWELVFAVDDGSRVHVGVRPTRTCSGVRPTTVGDLEGLTIEGANRSITLHRCDPEPLHCQAVP